GGEVAHGIDPHPLGAEPGAVGGGRAGREGDEDDGGERREDGRTDEHQALYNTGADGGRRIRHRRRRSRRGRTESSCRVARVGRRRTPGRDTAPLTWRTREGTRLRPNTCPAPGGQEP